MNKKHKKTADKKGVIIAHYGVAVDVLFAEDNARRMIRVKRNSGHVVGDNVIIQDDVLTRLPRSSELSRMDARGGKHIVGANLDVLCIVVSCEPTPAARICRPGNCLRPGQQPSPRSDNK